jgi:hypothetical protein
MQTQVTKTDSSITFAAQECKESKSTTIINESQNPFSTMAGLCRKLDEISVNQTKDTGRVPVGKTKRVLLLVIFALF